MLRVGSADQQQQKEAEEAAMQEQLSQFVSVKGVFVLEPKDDQLENLEMSSVPDSRQLLFVVFDVSNPTQQNIDATFTKLTLSYPSGNEYEATSSGYPNSISAFISNSGYRQLNSLKAIDAGAAPQRCIAVFSVGKTDLQGSDSPELKVSITGSGSDVKGSLSVANDSIVKIAMPDGVFQVEDNPDGYQLRRSMVVRCQLISTVLQTNSTYYNAGDTVRMGENEVIMDMAIRDDLSYGFSIAVSSVWSGDIVLTSDVPSMNYETLRSVDPSAADDAIKLNEAIDDLNTAMNSDDSKAATLADSTIRDIVNKYAYE